MSIITIAPHSQSGKPALNRQLRLHGFHPGTELWLKINNNNIYQCHVTADNFEAWRMAKAGEDDPKGGSKWERTRHYPDGYAHILNRARQGDEVFFIRNHPHGGIGKGHCTDFSQVFGEIDDRPILEQWDKLNEIARAIGIVPTVVVFSGGKSLHFYYSLTESVNPEQWQRLQRKQIILFESDPAIANPNREMRLAGFPRTKKGTQQTLDFESASRYTPEEFEAALDSTGLFPHGISDERWRQWRRWKLEKIGDVHSILNKPESELSPKSNYQSRSDFTYDGSVVPLEICLSKDDRELIARGISEGGRNETGYKLARDLIGTANQLQSMGIAFNGDPRQLFDEYCNRCTPALSVREGEQLWRSASRGNPSPSLPEEAIKNCIGAWQRKQNPNCHKSDRPLDAEPDAKEYAQYQQQEEERERAERAEVEERDRQKVAEVFDFFKSQAEKAKARADKLWEKWGFQSKTNLSPNVKKSSPVTLYQQGDRLKTWQSLRKSGKKYILDISGTGTGKSHDTGEISPEDFDVSRAIYISPDHRNPSTSTLAEWDDLEARHDGLYRDDLEKYRRRKDYRDPKDIRANCGRTSTINALRSLNVSGADTSEIICATCSFSEECRAGGGYNYLNQRAITLKGSNRFRAHPSSLPVADGVFPYAAGDYDGKPDDGTLHIFEEAGQTFKNYRTVEVSLADVDRTLGEIITHESFKDSPHRQTLISVLSQLRKMLNEKAPRFGHTHQDILASTEKTNLDETELIKILEALKPDLSFLDSTAEHGVPLEDLPAGVRKKFNERDNSTAQLVSQKITKQWFPEFLEILTGLKLGHFRTGRGTLILTLPALHAVEIAQAAECNIFLDATGNVSRYALMLGCDPEDIAAIAQEEPVGAEIIFKQIIGLGRFGMSRTESQLKRAIALIEEIKRHHPDGWAIFDFKKFASDTGAEYVHWRDARGLNDLQTCSTLIINGVPQSNIGALEAEFTLLYGRVPEAGTVEKYFPVQVTSAAPGIQPTLKMNVSADPEFADFCRADVLATLHQTFGRLRASRRPGEKLTVWILGEYPLDVPVTLIDAAKVTPAAAAKGDITRLALLDWLKAAGDKTITAASDAVGCAKQYLSKLAKPFGGWVSFVQFLTSLMNPSLSTKSIESFIEKVDNADELKALATNWLSALADEPFSDFVNEAAATISIYGWKAWRYMLAVASPETRLKLAKRLLEELPDEWRDAIDALVRPQPDLPEQRAIAVEHLKEVY